MVDEELVCYLFYIKHMSITQIADEIKASRKYVYEEIVYCWSNDCMAVNAHSYCKKHNRETEWLDG